MSVFGPRGYTPDHALLICASAHARESVNDTRIVSADCGHLVMIAPSGRAQLQKTPQMRTLCTTCFAGDVRLRKKMPFMKTGRLPGATDELRAALPKDEDTERFLDALNEHLEEFDYE